MTVYRIQSRQDRTRGAYDVGRWRNRPAVVKRLHNAHDFGDDKNHPSPRDDVGRNIIEGKEFAGCPSAVSLLRWFKGYIPDLLRAGYEIVALRNVTITAIGEYQVLFMWDEED